MLPYSTKYSPLPPPHTPTRPLKHGWYSPGRPDSPDEEESPASDGESSEGDPRETIVLAAAGEVVADEGSEGHAQESSAGMAVDQRVEDGLNVEANTNADFGGCMFHSFGVWEDEHRRQAVEDMISVSMTSYSPRHNCAEPSLTMTGQRWRIRLPTGLGRVDEPPCR
jgi:hypothetical protein